MARDHAHVSPWLTHTQGRRERQSEVPGLVKLEPVQANLANDSSGILIKLVDQPQEGGTKTKYIAT